MSTLRYCGEIRIRITYQESGPGKAYSPNGTYSCYLTAGERRTNIKVMAPRYLSRAVDSPEAFDEAACAALAFAGEGEEHGWNAYASFDDHGYYVSRSAPATVEDI